MSTENQNRENQNEKVDYQDLFNSLVKENEQKEPMAEKAKSKMKRKQKSQEKHQPSASQSQPELNKQHVSNENLHHSYAQNNHRTHVPQKKGRFYQSSCPYCGKKVGLFRTWMLKNKGDYFCPECGNRSAVVIDKVIVPMAITAVAISLILVLIFTFLVDMHIWSIILIFIPFLVFFCASVFLVRFKLLPVQNAKRNLFKMICRIHVSFNFMILFYRKEKFIYETSSISTAGLSILRSAF